MKGQTHYLENGAPWNGATHNHNGQLMTGKSHTKASVNLNPHVAAKAKPKAKPKAVKKPKKKPGY